MKSVLLINVSKYHSGSEISTYELFSRIDSKFKINWLVDENSKFEGSKEVRYNFIDVCFDVQFFLVFPLIKQIFGFIKQNIFVYKHIRKLNVEIVYFNTIKSVLSCIIVLFNRRIKKIVHIRDNIRYPFILKFLFKKMDFVIGISKSILINLEENKEKTSCIYNGISLNTLLSPNAILDNYSPITLGFVAQFTPWKNHFDFIKLAQIVQDKYDDCEFIMVGDILNKKDTKYKDSVLLEIKNLKLENKIKYLGFCDNMHEIYSDIDILIHTAIDEPFGRVLIEAMAMKIPVVAYNCGGPSEIILDGETGFLVKPHDYVALANRTMELIDDEDLRVQFGRKGRERVNMEFNIYKQVKKIEKILENL